MLFLLLYPLHSKSIAQDTIRFWKNKTWNEILALAKKEQKMILLDAYTTWCGACLKMDKTVFKDKATIAYLNENFINMKINAEKGEGVELAQTYNINCYPSFLLIDADGKALSSFCEGYTNPTAFLDKMMQTKQQALQIREAYQQYMTHQRDSVFLWQHINQLDKVGVSSENAFDAYWQTKTNPSQLHQKEMALIVRLLCNDNAFVVDYKSIIFKTYFAHIDDFKQHFDSTLLEHTTFTALVSNLIRYKRRQDEKAMTTLIPLNEQYNYIIKKYRNKPRKLARIRKAWYGNLAVSSYNEIH